MKNTLKTTLFTTLLVSSALSAAYDPFAAPAAAAKKVSKYAAAVAPIAAVDPTAKTIAQHKIDGVPGHVILENAHVATSGVALGAHTHLDRARHAELIGFETAAKDLATRNFAAISTQKDMLIELIAELKATHGANVNSAGLTADGTLDGMVNGAKLGAGHITLADGSDVDVAAAPNAALIRILTAPADLADKQALFAAFRAATAWTADPSEEADLLKTLYLRTLLA